MKVARDFEKIYSSEADPWNIGKADSDRYNLYYKLIIDHSRSRKTVMDIGCGFGAFLARFQHDFKNLFGVEISRDAISKGQERHPFISFTQGTADHLPDRLSNSERFDTILLSDVLYYLNEKGKHSCLQWISRHLQEDGLAFIAGWCPGGQYLEFDELERLVQRYFKIERSILLESNHAVFLARKKRRLVAVTIDYETWHPLPAGKTINWEKDIFEPTDELLRRCDQEEVKITLFAEMGEYFWLQANDPPTARRMENQLRDAVCRGHDVQLHLHPNWLPELGADCDHGNWHWDWSKARLSDYPGDLGVLFSRCKTALETLLRPVNPEYHVTSFRAGAYQIQPFKQIHDALTAHGIFCDSSVYAGAFSAERGNDFRLAYSDHQPYFANPFDPQLKALPAETDMIEIPVFTYAPNERWFLDNDEGSRLAEHLFHYIEQHANNTLSSEAYRRRKVLKTRLGNFYFRFASLHRWINKVLPKSLAALMTSYQPEVLVGHEYYVMIGHSKSALNFDQILHNFRILKDQGDVEFVGLSQMADLARKELNQHLCPSSTEQAANQVKREFTAILGDSRNEAQSFYLQEKIPWDKTNVLDLGCGSGYWSARIADLYPWMTVKGIDFGKEFIAKANQKFASERVSFQRVDFTRLPFNNETFECVYADNTLEHSFDVDKTLAEIYRTLKWNSVLLAAVPSDARNPHHICDNHTWKTAPHEARMRLANAGFVQIEIEEVDTFRTLGMPPYPPSDDRMMYIKAWKRTKEIAPLDRAREAMDWVYQTLKPDQSQFSDDPKVILAGGYAFCWGYAVVLGKLLQQEGINVKWLTMLAKDHPRGRGPEKVDSHEVLLADLGSGFVILDPMANHVIPYSLEKVLTQPAIVPSPNNPDDRYLSRGYEFYSTSFWYSRVFKYTIRRCPDQRLFFWRKNRWKK